MKVPRKPLMCVKHTKEELKFYCDTMSMSDLSRLHSDGAQRPQASLP